ncbi:MAG: hypothetical protein QXY39_03490 [Thermofilaceae archaeon]
MEPLGAGYRYLTPVDIEKFYLGATQHPFYALEEFEKAQGTVSTALGVPFWNVIYGAQAWRQINLEANVFGVLPKTDYPRSGWRVITALSTAAESIVTGETGQIPGPYYPEIRVVRSRPKVLSVSFKVSEVISELAARSADDVWASMHEIRVYYMAEFAKQINRLLLRPAVGRDARDIPVIDQASVTSLDQIVSSADEATRVYGDVPDQVRQNVNVYGLDRFGADAWSNAIVLQPFEGSTQPLTDALIRQLDVETKRKGANPTDSGRLWITGLKTWAAINGLYTQFVRYFPISEARITVGEMGYQYVPEGNQVGLRVSVLYNKPVILSADVYEDTGGYERIYLLDISDLEGFGAPRLGISILRPVEYFETRAEHFPLLREFTYMGVYRMIAETIARFIPGQGKIRDLA